MNVERTPRDPSRRTQTVSPSAKKAAERGGRWLYRLNVALVIVLAVAFTCWFYVHVRPYVKQTLFVGVPLTLWSLWELGNSFRGTFVSDDRLLALINMASPRVTIVLMLAFVVLGFFTLTTTSLYVEYDPVHAGETLEFEVHVKRAGRQFLQPLKVSSNEPVQGRPFLFWWPRETVRDLSFHITKPAGYLPIEETLGIRSRVYLKVPGDRFRKKDVYIVRLLPGGALLQQGPRVNESDRSPFSLLISIDDEPYKVDNVMFEGVCFGAPEEIIRNVLADETPEQRFVTMRNYLSRIDWDLPPAEKEELVRKRAEDLTSSWRIIDTIEHHPERRVTVRLQMNRHPPSAPFEVPLPEGPGIQNIGIEVSDQ